MSSVESTRDSLCEELSQNLNENVTEHEVVTVTIERNERGDTVKLERVTDRLRTRQLDDVRNRREERVRTEVVRDTIYLERRDSVSSVRIQGASARASPWIQGLKWMCWIIVSITVLIIVLKLTKVFK